jgi:hypothetical protein
MNLIHVTQDEDQELNFETPTELDISAAKFTEPDLARGL